MAGPARQLFAAVVEATVTWLPGTTGQRLRARYWRPRLAHMGSDVRIEVGAVFVGAEHISLGDRCWVDRFAVLLAGPAHRGARKVARRENRGHRGGEGEVIVGRNCHIASHTLINGHGGVTIGDDVTVAAGAKIVSLSHTHQNLDDPADTFRYRFSSRAPESAQALLSAPVVLETGAALGTNAVMLPGSTIEQDAWVGAGAVVSGTIPSASIAVGQPAVAVKTRSAGDEPNSP